MGVCSMSGFGGGMFGFGMLGMLGMLGLWALLVWAGLRLFRTWNGGSHRAEATLASRFAHGDIDEDEYQSRLDTLRGERPFSDWGALR